jgi:hypothetical protein
MIMSKIVLFFANHLLLISFFGDGKLWVDEIKNRFSVCLYFFAAL